jgi:hypothetical protein
MIGRVTSLTVVIAYLITAYLGRGGEAAIKMGIFLILPLACIWFSTEMGGYTGVNFGVRPAITETTPGCFVALAGWLLLTLPLIIGLISFLRQ